jgi:hypothetical protein
MKQASAGFPEKIDDQFAASNRFSLLTSDYRPVICEAREQKSLYISAEGTVDPCCHVGMNKPKFIWWEGDTALRQGNFPTNLENGITWFNQIEHTFGTADQMAVCSGVCGQ